jgi:hypothetical protein
MKILDNEFHFTNSGNAEIEQQWLQMAIAHDYEPAYPQIEKFLSTIGRRKYLKRLYAELIKTPKGKEWALKIYAKARPAYHPITRATISEVLNS